MKAGGEGDLVPIIFGALIGFFVVLLAIRQGMSYLATQKEAARERARELAVSRAATLAKIRERAGPPEKRRRKKRKPKEQKEGAAAAAAGAAAQVADVEAQRGEAGAGAEKRERGRSGGR